MRHRYVTAAELEAGDAAIFYESQEPGLGAEFVEELDRTISTNLESTAGRVSGPKKYQKILAQAISV